MFGVPSLLLQSFIFLNLLQEDWVLRLGVLYHGSQHGLDHLSQSGLAGLLVSDGEESGVILLAPAALNTPVVHGLGPHLQVQFGLGGRDPVNTKYLISFHLPILVPDLILPQLAVLGDLFQHGRVAWSVLKTGHDRPDLLQGLTLKCDVLNYHSLLFLPHS